MGTPVLARIALVAGLMLGATAVHADDFSVNPVGSDGSSTVKTIFGFDETPFLHLHLPSNALNFTTSFWNAPSSASYFTSHGPSTDQDVWFSLVNWNTIREKGLWNVNAGVLFAQGGSASDQTSFTVTPEPMSAALFVVGGLTLALASRRKKNALNV